MEILELKNILTEIKLSLNKIKSSLGKWQSMILQKFTPS